MLPSPEETLMTLGAEDLYRRGENAVVMMATEVMLTSRFHCRCHGPLRDRVLMGDE